MPLKVIFQTALDASQPGLNVGQVILTDPSHLPPDKEQRWEDEHTNDVEDDLKVQLQKGTPLSAAPNSSVFMSSIGLAARKTGVLAPTVAAFLASSILAA